jgi:hypothetical protein
VGGFVFKGRRAGDSRAAVSVRETLRWPIACALLIGLLVCAPARADVGVVLNESLDTSVARITGSGHSAVYLSRICPETPVKLRLCRPGEEGSVVSNYTTLGEDQPYEWNAVPLSIFLYGVEDPANRPLFGSEKFKRALEERYRQKYLAGFCESKVCRTSHGAEWREMVAATMERSLYIFIIKTTVEQDEQLIAELNSQPNVNHFNGVTRNCANFTERLINTYYPHATGRNYLNDFGIASPKAIARSFVRYAGRHPEAEFRALHFTQMPGTYRRSTNCREATEQLYRSKKLLVPMLVFANHELPFMAASYMLAGKFDPEKKWEEHPTAGLGEAEFSSGEEEFERRNEGSLELGAAGPEERAQILGTPEEWAGYRKQVNAMIEAAVGNETISRSGYLDHLFKLFDKNGKFEAESDGAVWMELSTPDGMRRAGVSASNVFAPSSDELLGYEIFLARASRIVRSPKHGRESMLEFKSDWLALATARARLGESNAPAMVLASPVRPELPSVPGGD